MDQAQSRNGPLPMLETPLLLLDRDRLDANLARMRGRLSAFPLTLRPHVKTSKCLAVVERLFDGGRGPITVSTLAEADFFFAAGYRDILYAVGIVANKFAHAAALLRAGAALTLILDSLDAAHALVAYAATQEQQFSVLLEIDCDGHRSGLAPASPLLAQIAAVLRDGGVRLLGVMTTPAVRMTAVRRPRSRVARVWSATACGRRRRCWRRPAFRSRPSASVRRRPRCSPRTSTASPKCVPACLCSSIWSCMASASAASKTSRYRS